MILAAGLGVLAVLVAAHEFIPSSSTIASTTATESQAFSPSAVRSPARRGSGSGSGKKARPPQSLDPTLRLQQLAATEQIKYEGSGRNIFVSQPDPVIPTPLAPGATDNKDAQLYHPPAAPVQPPIPLKFFGFSNLPGEPKKVFLLKGEDIFVAGEGEIVDRRYKVVRISPTSVDIQDVVGSGPPQSVPLTQGTGGI
jgi:hypothetical protein